MFEHKDTLQFSEHLYIPKTLNQSKSLKLNHFHKNANLLVNL